MKSILFVFVILKLQVNLQASFEQNFTGEELRVDFIMAGDATETDIYLSGLSISPLWSGTRIYLQDPFYYGNFYFIVRDSASGEELFSRGFNTLYGEWQTTAESAVLRKAFQNTVRMPRPRESFYLEFYRRISMEESVPVTSFPINPNDFKIEKTSDWGKEIIEFDVKVEPGSAVDLLFVGEGYTTGESSKFSEDAEKAIRALFSVDPFRDYREHFNIRGVFAPSERSGPDNPGLDQWNITPAESSFYTFGSERYLTIHDYWRLQDLADGIPFDHLVVIVNTDKYGGGAIYNHFTVFVSDHQVSDQLLLHELGHGFSGLGDEYYDSEVAYSEFYKTDREPLTPNLTTLVDFESKWMDMIEEGTPVPTPPLARYKKTTGVFEGGGYSAKGIYRPFITCRMKDNNAAHFCPVCRRSMEEMIRYYMGLPLQP